MTTITTLLAWLLWRCACCSCAPAASMRTDRYAVLCCRVFDAERLIGRKYSDPVIQGDKKTWPFKLVKGSFDKPMVSVSYQGRGKTLLQRTYHPKCSQR